MIIVSLKNLARCEQHNHAHSLVAQGLKKFDIDYSEDLLSYSQNGKPYLYSYPDLKFNLSHADGITACYIGKYESGIDAEPVRKYRTQVVRRSFSQSEKEFIERSDNKDLDFFRLWTLKESYVKAIGIGISYPLNTVEFDFSGDKIASNITGCSFYQHIFQKRYVVSLCLLHKEYN